MAKTNKKTNKTEKFKSASVAPEVNEEVVADAVAEMMSMTADEISEQSKVVAEKTEVVKEEEAPIVEKIKEQSVVEETVELPEEKVVSEEVKDNEDFLKEIDKIRESQVEDKAFEEIKKDDDKKRRVRTVQSLYGYDFFGMCYD